VAFLRVGADRIVATPEDMTDGSVVADLKTVVAPLNFLVPTTEKPVAYNYEPPPGSPSGRARAKSEGSCVKIPAKRVHNDYTAWSSPQRVRQLMGEEAEELLNTA
jgi:hypothetical protein